MFPFLSLTISHILLPFLVPTFVQRRNITVRVRHQVCLRREELMAKYLHLDLEKTREREAPTCGQDKEGRERKDGMITSHEMRAWNMRVGKESQDKGKEERVRLSPLMRLDLFIAQMKHGHPLSLR